MDDRLRETLSAMMDDEADELAVRRLLSFSDQDEVRGQWQRWQHIHDLMHGTAPQPTRFRRPPMLVPVFGSALTAGRLRQSTMR